MNRINKIINSIAILVVFFALSFSIFFWWSFLYPIKTVTLLEPIRVSPQVVQCGERISVYIHFNKHTDIKPIVKYYLINSEVRELSSDSTRRPIGESTVVRFFDTPCVNGGGLYKVQVDLTYQLYPWRTVNHSWSSNEFRIIH
jgi:hypothetical protein